MSSPTRPRHSTDGGYPRGEETRLRIIEAAIALFGERGFDAASTREIAAHAGVNAPALQYYFDNKEGVYRACAEHIAAQAAERFRPLIEQADALLDQHADTTTLIDMFCRIQDGVADHVLGSRDAQTRLLFMAREQSGHGPSTTFEILQRTVSQQMIRVGAELISRVSGEPADAPLTLIRMMTVHGQLKIFHIARRSMLATLGWPDFDAERLALLKATVRAQTRTLFESWIPRKP